MLRIAMMMACLSAGQVRAEMFDTSKLSASDFDTLGTLAYKWEDKAEQIDANSTINQLSNLTVSDVYREAAQDLRGALGHIRDKRNSFDVAQISGQNFSSGPPTNNSGVKVPVGPELEKRYPTPNQAPVQAPQKQVQAPSYPAQAPAMSCGMQMQQPVYTNYSSGGRFRLFGRRANGGGFRLFGRRGGC